MTTFDVAVQITREDGSTERFTTSQTVSAESDALDAIRAVWPWLRLEVVSLLAQAIGSEYGLELPTIESLKDGSA